MMGERAAAVRPRPDHHLDAVPREEADRRRVDRRIDDPLHAAFEQRHAAAPRALRRDGAGPRRAPGRRHRPRHEPPERAEPARQPRDERPERPASHERAPEPGRARQQPAEQVSERAVGQRPAEGLLDAAPRMIDEMHVVHARGAGRHAGEAGKAAVDVERGRCRGRLVALQHLLHEIDAAARAVELVAEQDVGRAGGGAEAAMHAGAEDLLRGGDVRIGELGRAKAGLHRARSRPGGAWRD
jgi:hypothetical protein